jgi:ribonucleoside-diphosphate reductase alpha chain
VVALKTEQERARAKDEGAQGRELPWPELVRRRDESLVAFDLSRINNAVARAGREAGRHDRDLGQAVAIAVANELGRRFSTRPPRVEEIQDAVEAQLMAMGLDDVAKAYVLYRHHRQELRDAKALLGVRDELKLSLAAASVLQARYLRRNEDGQVVESTGEMMDRVAATVAGAEDLYAPGTSAMWAERFSSLLRRLDFLPNSPTLMNAGSPIGLLSACVVLPVEDSLRSIFTSLGQAALIHQAGGGTGYAFSHLRPRGDRVASTGGKASGPLSFLTVFDAAAEVVSTGGRRRGACMAVLDASHPDIFEFIGAKAGARGALGHFNLSVGVSDAFMRAAARGGRHRLVNPRNGRLVTEVGADVLLEAIARAAHSCGDPGMLFLDRINRANPLPSAGRIEATNPCGEVPLLPYESCNLGSINLSHFVVGDKVDWERLATTARLAARFLDDVIDVSHYPIPELEQAALATRKVGLGVMGLAEMLASIGIPYDSDEAVRLGARIARVLRREARIASAELAAQRGTFPRFAESIFAKSGLALRNAQLTSIAPTGTISLIAGTTSGIEPMFALSYVREVLGHRLVETNPRFERLARDRGFYSEELVHEIARVGGVRSNPAVPKDVRAAFVTAHEIAPSWHLRMQAAVQRHVDAAVSKTVNLPEHASVEEVRELFLAAWRSGVKGITIYRYGSRSDEVLSFLGEGPEPSAPIKVGAEFTGGCAGHSCEY